MGVITEIKEQKRHRDRVSIFVDGRFSVGMSRLAMIKAGLMVGQEVSSERLQALEAEAAVEEAMSAAMRYLVARPRSERELKTRLRRRGSDDDTIDQVVANLRRTGLLGDLTFAQYWVEQRVAFRPRSRRLLESELRQKGVDKEIIDEVASDLDDEAEAYRAGLKRARSLPRGDYQSFYKKLVTYLKGRGFGYATSSKTARGLWSELSAGSEE